MILNGFGIIGRLTEHFFKFNSARRRVVFWVDGEPYDFRSIQNDRTVTSITLQKGTV